MDIGINEQDNVGWGCRGLLYLREIKYKQKLNETETDDGLTEVDLSVDDDGKSTKPVIQPNEAKKRKVSYVEKKRENINRYSKIHKDPEIQQLSKMVGSLRLAAETNKSTDDELLFVVDPTDEGIDISLTNKNGETIKYGDGVFDKAEVHLSKYDISEVEQSFEPSLSASTSVTGYKSVVSTGSSLSNLSVKSTSSFSNLGVKKVINDTYNEYISAPATTRVASTESAKSVTSNDAGMITTSLFEHPPGIIGHVNMDAIVIKDYVEKKGNVLEIMKTKLAKTSIELAQETAARKERFNKAKGPRHSSRQSDSSSSTIFDETILKLQKAEEEQKKAVDDASKKLTDAQKTAESVKTDPSGTDAGEDGDMSSHPSTDSSIKEVPPLVLEDLEKFLIRTRGKYEDMDCVTDLVVKAIGISHELGSKDLPTFGAQIKQYKKKLKEDKESYTITDEEMDKFFECIHGGEGEGDVGGVESWEEFINMFPRTTSTIPDVVDHSDPKQVRAFYHYAINTESGKSHAGIVTLVNRVKAITFLKQYREEEAAGQGDIGRFDDRTTGNTSVSGDNPNPKSITSFPIEDFKINIPDNWNPFEPAMSPLEYDDTDTDDEDKDKKNAANMPQPPAGSVMPPEPPVKEEDLGGRNKGGSKKGSRNTSQKRGGFIKGILKKMSTCGCKKKTRRRNGKKFTVRKRKGKGKKAGGKRTARKQKKSGGAKERRVRFTVKR